MEIVASVIIPAHDAAAHLGAALASARRQTLRRIEVIVVDDGSADGTWAVIEAAAAADPRIRAVRRPRAGGPAAARNAGLRLARGRWIAPLDADDLFRPRRLARLVARAERLGADLVADDQLLWPEGAARPRGRLFGRGAAAGPIGLAELIGRDMPAGRSGTGPRGGAAHGPRGGAAHGPRGGAAHGPRGGAAHGPRGGAAIGYAKPLVRRDFLARHAIAWQEAARAGEDLLFLAECVARGGRFFLLPSAHDVYRLREGSESRRPGLARLQAMTNRRLAALARGAADARAAVLLAERQARLDRSALADAAVAADWTAALGLVRWRRPALLGADLRLLAGAARRRLLGRG